MEHIVIAIGILAVIWVLVNQFVTLPAPMGQVLNIVFVVILIVLLLRAFVGTAHAQACGITTYCDANGFCYQVPVCQ